MYIMDFYYIYYLFLRKIFLMLFILGFTKERTNVCMHVYASVRLCVCIYACVCVCVYVFVY